MNRYPIWKYLLIAVVICLGFIYAMPNIYPPDPAVQVSGTSAALEITQDVLDDVTETLDEANIDYFGAEFDATNALVRFKTQEDQRRARDAINKSLSNDFTVAVNLAPTTPEWLSSLGASPMKLGLDLAGGVHFLMEVDTAKVINEELVGLEDALRRSMIEQNLRGVSISRSGNVISIAAENDEKRQQMTSLLRSDYPQLQYDRFEREGRYIAEARLTDAYIKEKENYAVSQNLSTLRNRVNLIGVSEPLVQRQGRNRIVVELPGIQDTARAKSIIGKTANLEFRMEARPDELSARKERFPYYDDQDQSRFGSPYLERRVIIKGDKVTNAQLGFDQNTSQPQVNITLDGEGGKLMHRATRDNIGRRMGTLFIEYETQEETVVNDQGETVRKFIQIPEKKIISLATVQDALGKQFRITGLDNPQAAKELALLLRAGALAAPMAFVEERTIGPSLGAENVALGVKSVQIGLALVLVFMLIYYRVFGIAANIALAVNLVLLVAVMSMFGATLTLPGIAGIVLTVGMAVDANVLIFSRIREELKSGQPNQSAISAGFDRAFTTILDANVTTFIVAIILYAIGSGPVRGFAVTLAIGILTSMFTAIMVTRSIVNMIYGGRSVQKLWI